MKVLVDERKVEQLRVFFAMFMAIMDTPDYSNLERLGKLRILRDELEKII